jgi:hypothetical protein
MAKPQSQLGGNGKPPGRKWITTDTPDNPEGNDSSTPQLTLRPRARNAPIEETESTAGVQIAQKRTPKKHQQIRKFLPFLLLALLLFLAYLAVSR